MIQTCYYCKVEPSKGLLAHPRFGTLQPTCARCEMSLNLYYPQLNLLTKVGCLPPLVLLGGGLIAGFSGHWGLGLSSIGAGIVIIVGTQLAMSHYREKRDRATGDYVDEKALRWCKTCVHFRRRAGWDDMMNGMWTSAALPDVSMLPCAKPEETLKTWRDYFERPRGKRTLYPGDCPSWQKAAK